MKESILFELGILWKLANVVMAWPWRETSSVWWVRALCWLAVLAEIFFIPALWEGYGWEVATFFMFITLIYSVSWKPNREL